MNNVTASAEKIALACIIAVMGWMGNWVFDVSKEVTELKSTQRTIDRDIDKIQQNSTDIAVVKAQLETLKKETVEVRTLLIKLSEAR